MTNRTAIPYFSQWQDPAYTSAIIGGADPCDDPLWVNSGFRDADQYRYWSLRLCGIACLRSILAAKKLPSQSQYDLLQEALRRGVYKRRPDGTVLGMIYQPFCAWLDEAYQIKANFFEHTPLDELLQKRRPKDLTIMSVSPEIREPETESPSKGGHLVLVTSHDNLSVTLHNPSGFPPNHAHAKMSLKHFDKFYAERGIHISL